MSLLSTLLFASTVLSVPLESLASRQTFSLDQVAVNRTIRTPMQVVKEAYWKYAIDLPADLEEAEQQIKTVNRITNAPPGGGITTSVVAKSVKNDLQYLISVKVGKHDLMLDLDTGSSDL
jgi:hypothetical protein